MKQAESLSKFVVPVGSRAPSSPPARPTSGIFAAAAVALQRTNFEAFGAVLSAE